MRHLSYRILKLKPSYNSLKDDVTTEFYNKVLKNSVRYDRVSAYFDSKTLVSFSRGLEQIYKEKGKVRYIISHDISEEDYKLIKEGYYNKTEVSKNILSEINGISVENAPFIANLAYLITIGFVEVKVAFCKNGLFHDKFGLMYSKENEIIYFRGSNNETNAAIKRNYETFEISSTLNDYEIENIKIKNAVEEFENLWENNIENLLVLNIPEVVKLELIKFSKGKLVEVSNVFYFDRVILDYDIINDEFYIYDLSKKMNKNDFDFKLKVSKYINIFNENKFILHNDINLSKLKELIKRMEKYSSVSNLNFKVSESCIEFIKSKELYIKERYELGLILKNDLEKFIDKFNNFKDILSNNMQRTLRDPQLHNAFYHYFMKSSMNFSVPGSGKTSIIYGLFAYLNSQEIDLIDKIVVIGPKSSFLAWKEEFVKCFGTLKKLELFNVQDKTRLNEDVNLYLKAKAFKENVFLFNYEKLKSLKNGIKSLVNSRTLLVFDEIHRIKKQEGSCFIASQAFIDRTKYKVVLTGTPIPNGFQDVFNMLNILYPNDYDSFFNYSYKDLNNLEKGEKIKEFNNLLFPFFVRTTKKDLHIPEPLVDKIITVQLTIEETKLLKNIYFKTETNYLHKFIRVVQLCSNAKSLLNNSIDLTELIDFDYDNDFSKLKLSSDDIELIKKIGDSTKLKSLLEHIQSIQDEKLIIWCIFNNTIDLINQKLEDIGVSSFIINGKKTLAEREELINKFKNDKTRIIICNPQTMAESVSLHEVCHHAIYFEYSFNLTHFLQSKDRIHRLGLKSDQETKYTIFQSVNDEVKYKPVDKIVYERLKEKETNLLESVEGNIVKPMENISIKDFEKLFN